MELYHRIKARREELGMSQEELAKKMGYKSRSSINKIELGHSDIPQSKIVKFANALDTTPEYLMGIEDNSSYEEMDIFEEAMSLIGWGYDTLYNCDGLYINEYLDDADKIECEGSTSSEKCQHCIHNCPYYYINDGKHYYRLTKEEFDQLSSCIISYLRYRINEVVSKKPVLTKSEYQKEEYLLSEQALQAAHEDAAGATPEQKKHADDIMTDDSEWE